MNCNELKKRLGEKNVDRNSYSILSGIRYPNECYCLIFEDGVWKYYYSERGHMTGLKEFTSESEACEYFYRQVIRDLSY